MYYFPYFQGRVPAWNLAGLLPPDPTSPGPGGPSPGAVSAPGGLAHPLPHYSGAYGGQPTTPAHYSHLLPQGNLLKGINNCLDVAWSVVQVSKSQKQIIMSLILPKNKLSNHTQDAIILSWVCLVQFLEESGCCNNIRDFIIWFRDLLTFKPWTTVSATFFSIF